MESNYQNILELFSELETRKISETYLEKYWLSEDEWQKKWQPLKDKVFHTEFTRLPDMMYREEYLLITLVGGVIFTEDDFLALQKCMFDAGDKWFVVIENKYMQPTLINDNGKTFVHPLLRFKYPVEITWKELLNGGLLSMELFESSYKEFFVFGSSSKWGKYAANEYWDRSVDPIGTPLDIIGFKTELVSVFQKYFKQSKEEQQKIKDWIPEEYKKRLIN